MSGSIAGIKVVTFGNVLSPRECFLTFLFFHSGSRFCVLDQGEELCNFRKHNHIDSRYCAFEKGGINQEALSNCSNILSLDNF